MQVSVNPLRRGHVCPRHTDLTLRSYVSARARLYRFWSSLYTLQLISLSLSLDLSRRFILLCFLPAIHQYDITVVILVRQSRLNLNFKDCSPLPSHSAKIYLISSRHRSADYPAASAPASSRESCTLIPNLITFDCISGPFCRCDVKRFSQSRVKDFFTCLQMLHGLWNITSWNSRSNADKILVTSYRG